MVFFPTKMMLSLCYVFFQCFCGILFLGVHVSEVSMLYVLGIRRYLRVFRFCFFRLVGCRENIQSLMLMMC